MSESGLPNIFWEVHSNLPREGPGDKASTQRAFKLATDLPPAPRILDLGCGPGMQTLDLAEISPQALITAVDTHQPFLDELSQRATSAGLGSRIQPLNASMLELPFEDQSFDLIWCEGAMYFLGFNPALDQWRRLLRPQGYLAVTEPCWLKDQLPQAVLEHWAEYPAMTDIGSCQRMMSEAGYHEVGHFVLPDAAWWDDYYLPMLKRIGQLRSKYAEDVQAQAALDLAQSETEIHRKYSAYYGYVFFVMQLQT